MKLYKDDTFTFVDNKGELWEPALCHERQWFLFIRIVFI